MYIYIQGPNYVMPVENINDPLAIVEFVDIYSTPLIWHYSNELSAQVGVHICTYMHISAQVGVHTYIHTYVYMIHTTTHIIIIFI